MGFVDKVYNHQEVEDKIYKDWEEKGYFKPEVHPNGTPYCIILPPPNANGALHFGHAMFVIEDILIRYHRMKGFSALWLPGTDHAGIETQFVFEKKLKEMGKSRLDFNQETLYKMIHEYVEEHRGGIENQLRKLGFSLDWSREKYTLDPDIIKLVHQTFKKMYDEGLVYRDYRLVNYCTFDGTSFSDLEVVYEERKAPLYYMKYGPFTIATVRPETKFRDTALAVNPNDKRYKDKIGKIYHIKGLLGEVSMKIIADPEVNPEFGTGIMKVTPAHDPHDFELGKKYNLPVTPIIGMDGKMDFSWFLKKKDIEEIYRQRATKYHGKYIKEARKLMVEDLQADGLLLKTDENYTHRIGLCYKCKNVLEPLPLEQWFIKVKPLTQKAIEAVEKGSISIHPKNFEGQYFQWLENLRDWNISRQIVWGIRIPAWKNKKTGEWVVTEGDVPQGNEWEQDTDTFDTWFSSGQWPFVTLQSLRVNPSGKSDFEKFYPTSVMETGYDLLRAWISRMVMMGLYVTGKVPFKGVLFHGLVNDPYGKKMSKSKGNVINPLELVKQYGADAVRFALVYGNATGNDQSLSYPKLDAARKFTNKLWNIGRFIEFAEQNIKEGKKPIVTNKIGEWNEFWQNKVQDLTKEITRDLNNYNFNFAAEKLYEFIWHEFADKYIEDIKPRMTTDTMNILRDNFLVILKLLHPFMPFITEEIYKRLGAKDVLMISPWPKE